MITLDNYRETTFEAIEAAWLDGSLDVDTFTTIAQDVRAVTYRCTYPGAGTPNWARYPASLLECSTLSPNRLDDMLRMGTVSESLYDQYRQWWRLATPRLSSVWDDTEAMPVHPRVQEMLDRTMRVGTQREKDNIAASAEGSMTQDEREIAALTEEREREKRLEARGFILAPDGSWILKSVWVAHLRKLRRTER